MASTSYANREKDDDDRMPSPEAIQNLLPNYKYIFHDPSRKQTETRKPDVAGLSDREPKVETDKQPAVNQSLEQSQMTMLDYQMKEIDNYRQAVHKMGKDILTLRDHIHNLEDTNASLRRQLHKYDDTRKLMLDASDIDTIDKNELIVRYMTLKQKLQTQANEVAAYKEKIQKLQNELIKKNNQEKGYAELRQAHMTQAQHLRSLQEKVGKVKQMEEACKAQEKVIEKMEKILQNKQSKTGHDDVLVDENKRLRYELEKNKNEDSNSEIEKVRLYEQLDRAENRISTLERTLIDNSREWGKERAEMLTKLNETNHGLARTYGVIPQNTAAYQPSRSLDLPYNRKWYGSAKLDPIHW